MGIQAPTTSNTFTDIQFALMSHNRPLLLLGFFIISFLASLFLLKRNTVTAIIIAASVTFALALYFALTFVNSVRY